MIILKNKKQIEGIRKSCQLARATLDYIRPHVQVGVTTGYLNELIEKFIRDHGAKPAPLGYKGHGGIPYPAATCISVNEVICHGIPGSYALKEGDILNIDVTTILGGYYGDTSTMYTVGEISPEARKLLDVTKQCLDIGIKQVKPGNHIGRIGYEINEFATANGCSVVIVFCGHGFGIKFHEDPQVPHVAPKDWGPKMRPRMTFTIEPMINLGSPDAIINEGDGWTATTKDGGLSAQYEHSILVTEQGYEILTL